MRADDSSSQYITATSEPAHGTAQHCERALDVADGPRRDFMHAKYHAIANWTEPIEYHEAGFQTALATFSALRIAGV